MTSNSTISLDELGLKYGTDKSSAHHGYLDKYERILGHLRGEPFNLLEIGWGGYHFPERGGNSARMWEEYFPLAFIASIDIYQKDHPKNGRIFFFKGSQTDEAFLRGLINTLNPLVVIDDGSHKCPDVIKSFEIMYPLLKKGAYYIIEDTHSSYWDEIASDGTDFGGGNHENTTINYFKRMCDALNMDECSGRGVLKGLDVEAMVYRNIESIQFFKKMIVIQKK